MKSKVLFGMLFVIVGLIFGLQELGLISNLGLNGNIIFPLVVIIFGLTILFNNHNIIFGGIVTFLGFVNLMDNWYPQVDKIIFPGILVIVGIEILFGSLFKKFHKKDNINLYKADTINANAFLGGIEKKVVTQNFKGGKANAFLGGIMLDLTEINLTNDVILEVNAFMGGIEIKLPPNIKINSDINGFLGGVEIKYQPKETIGEYTIFLKGIAIMGGVEVK